MKVGLGQLDAFIIEKPAPRQNKEKTQTYYVLQVGNIGWTQRLACTVEAYNLAQVDTKPVRLIGRLDAVRATRVNGAFPDDYQVMTVEQIKEIPPAAPAK